MIAECITIQPGKRSGQPCIRGLRLTVWNVLGWLAAGQTEQETLEDFIAVYDCAARLGRRVAPVKLLLTRIFHANLLLLAALASAQAHAGWERQVNMEGSFFIDQPLPHSLAYFKASACPAAALKDRLGKCSLSARTELTSIGRAGGYTVYDLDYFFEEGTRVGAKSILIQFAPKLYYEIYHNRLTGVPEMLYPTQLFTVDAHRILATTWEEGTMYHAQNQTFFNVRADGVRLMHPQLLHEAGVRALPAGQDIWGPACSFDFASQEWQAGVGPIGKMSKTFCCPSLLTVKFTIENGEFVPGLVSIKPIE